jgi:hypothetical protein
MCNVSVVDLQKNRISHEAFCGKKEQNGCKQFGNDSCANTNLTQDMVNIYHIYIKPAVFLYYILMCTGLASIMSKSVILKFQQKSKIYTTLTKN